MNTSEEAKREIILIKISGQDKRGVTSALTEILANYNATILDIGQADIHHTLSLGVLFMTSCDKSGDIFKDLLIKTSELNVQVNFTMVSEEDYDNWVNMQGKNRWIITLLGRQLTARQISVVASIIAEQGLNIDSIRRLTGRIPLRIGERQMEKSCIEFSVRGTPKDRMKMQRQLMEKAAALNFDISMQEDNMFRRNRRLICFDMDSTLIRTEVIDELADRACVGRDVREITESAMRGEIDFCESFTRRVALLEGL